MSRFLVSIILIPVGLITGYLLNNLIGSRINTGSLRKNLQKIALLGMNPIAFLGAVWILPIHSIDIIAIPFLGAFALFLGGALALIIGKIRKMERNRLGAFFTLGSFTNIGSLGGLVVYGFLGEVGFTLLPFYKLLEELLYYSVGFPIARTHSNYSAQEEKGQLSNRLKDPFIIAALSAIGAGLILNLSGAERPGWYSNLNSFLIPAASFLLLVSIGLAMKVRNIKTYWRSGVWLMVIKFFVVPASVTTLGWLLGLGNIMDGLPLRVVFILSSMPSGFISLIPPSIYDLDLDFANSCWLIVMLGLCVSLPWIAFVLRYVFPLL